MIRSFVLLAVCAGALGAAELDQLGWLAGCWARPDGSSEEHWMKPAGGSMMGMSRTVKGGKMVEYEFLMIREVAGKLSYVAKPSRQSEATFPLKTLSENEVVFENLQHDFPHRIIYKKNADGSATARIEGMRGGQPRGIDFPFKRCQ
jgi:hypothetical protein